MTQHGGIARAANSSVTCGTAAPGATTPCAYAQQGYGGANGQYGMEYVDVDKDPNTYNSSSAYLGLPAGSRVSYARLYWGGNLRAGEQKPYGDNGRVLLAEPGGQYKEVLADTVTGHRRNAKTDAFQASADVTKLVRDTEPGYWTTAQVNVAKGRSAAGSWGGWTLVVAYENAQQPRRKLALWDGFQSLDAHHKELSVNLKGMRIPPRTSSGLAGVVAYNGDRGRVNDSLSVATDRNSPVALTNGANPANDVMNSTITDFGQETARLPAYRNTLGFDSDVFDITPALRSGGNRVAFRFAPGDAGYVLGALYVQADTGS